MTLGAIVYDDGGLVLPITSIRFERGLIVMEGEVRGPGKITFGGRFRVHGSDGVVVFAATIRRESMELRANAVGHITQTVSIEAMEGTCDG